MNRGATAHERYVTCSNEGSFIPLAEVDVDQVQAMVAIAMVDFESVAKWRTSASRDGGEWNAFFKLSYDILHTLAEAFLLLTGMKARTHECLFACLCEKHPELEFDWEFLDNVRRRRNRSIYYGEPVTYEQWVHIESQFNLYISTLHHALQEQLK